MRLPGFFYINVRSRNAHELLNTLAGLSRSGAARAFYFVCRDSDLFPISDRHHLELRARFSLTHRKLNVQHQLGHKVFLYPCLMHHIPLTIPSIRLGEYYINISVNHNR